ncbi:hypothetical protein BH10PLA2_BH10PLA2_36470 [soil metagenome]
MNATFKTPGELTQLILAKSVQKFGPWPSNLDVFVYRTDSGWEYVITPTNDPAELSYCRKVLRLGRKLEKMVRLKA